MLVATPATLRFFVETAPSEQHFIDPLAVPAPLLYFVEVLPVGVARIVGFAVGSVVGHR
jgi:hypothetical protein